MRKLVRFSVSSIIILIGILSGLCQLSAEAAPRSQNPIGFFAGFVGQPSPSLFSINAAYNIGDFARVAAGGGPLFFGAESYGATITYFLTGESRTTMASGLGFTHVTATESTGSSFLDFFFNPIPEAAQVIPVFLGIDHQAYSGFHFAVGMSYMISLKDSIDSALLPYFHLGWFLGGKDSESSEKQSQ